MNSVGAITTYTFHLYRSEDYPSEHPIMLRILAYPAPLFQLDRDTGGCTRTIDAFAIAYCVLYQRRVV